MVKFNTLKKGSTKTVNHEGASAYLPSDKLALMLRTMSFMMSGDSFYTKEKETSDAILALVKNISKKDAEYVLKLAKFARNEMYLRTVPVFLLVEYAKAGTKLEGAYKHVPQILKRADEPAEALAYYFQSSGSRKIPAMLKKGIAETLNNFDEYQFGKYNRDAMVKLKDVLFLTHPKAKSAEQQEIFDKIANDTLATPFTWETHISKNGSTKETWGQVIPNMGYMATLRNLRNFVVKDVKLKPVIDKLTNPEAVRNAKQFPYRYFSAYRELEIVKAPSKLLDAVNTAMDMSVINVPKIPGKTFIASDNSGSMRATVTEKSKVQCIDIAALFSAISMHVCDEAKVGVFGETYETVPLSKKSTILDNMAKIAQTDVGYSTNAWLAIEDIMKKGEFYDRIFIFSDMQCYNTYGYDRDDGLAGLVNKYRDEINPKCRLYSFDVQHYGLLKFPENDPLTCPVAGYSDTVFRFVPMFEENRNTMLKSIEQYSLSA